MSCLKLPGAEELLEDSEDVSLNAAGGVEAGNNRMYVSVQNDL